MLLYVKSCNFPRMKKYTVKIKTIRLCLDTFGYFIVGHLALRLAHSPRDPFLL